MVGFEVLQYMYVPVYDQSKEQPSISVALAGAIKPNVDNLTKPVIVWHLYWWNRRNSEHYRLLTDQNSTISLMWLVKQANTSNLSAKMEWQLCYSETNCICLPQINVMSVSFIYYFQKSYFNHYHIKSLWLGDAYDTYWPGHHLFR